MYIYKLFLKFLKKQQKSWFKIMFIYIRGKCEDIEVISIEILIGNFEYK